MQILSSNKKKKNGSYEIAKQYINEEKQVTTIEEALDGALDIIAENISDVAEYRKKIKSLFFRVAIIDSV